MRRSATTAFAEPHSIASDAMLASLVATQTVVRHNVCAERTPCHCPCFVETLRLVVLYYIPLQEGVNRPDHVDHDGG